MLNTSSHLHLTPAIHKNHTLDYTYPHPQHLKVYRRSGSGDDLPEYPTTARVHVETDASLIPRAYPAYMTSRQAFNRLYIKLIVLYGKSSLTSLNHNLRVSFSSDFTNQYNLLRCLELSPRHCGISRVQPPCRLHEDQTMCSEDLGQQ
jgi:hypothetical protein